jgi:hypothetical protein
LDENDKYEGAVGLSSKMRDVVNENRRASFKIVLTAMADTQSDGDPTITQSNPAQLRAVSSSIQM